MSTLQQLTPYFKELRLSGILAGLEARLEQASGEQWGYEEFLSRLLQEEVERRHQKQLDLALRRGNVTSTKTLETFDFGFNPSINRRQILDLAAGSYL
ncbi:MAG: ATP-binding protein, partial [Chloroflexota bacterium]